MADLIFKTNISQLDALLKDGGIVIPEASPDGVSILITGPAGAGKSTLALLLAARLAKEGRPVLYCALEQSDYSLRRLARSLVVDEHGWQWISEGEAQSREGMGGFICVTTVGGRGLQLGFEDRLRRLKEQMDRYITGYGTRDLTMVVVDSLDVFGHGPVTRREFEQLRGILSATNRILIFTGEAGPGGETWDRLVDLVIELGHKTPLDYSLRTIRTSKARFQNHIMGSHIIKIRGIPFQAQRELEATSQKPETEPLADFGFFIFPSLHYHLSVAIEIAHKRALDINRRRRENPLQTGFPALDEALGGGLKPSTMAAITSDFTNDGKSLGLSFLAQGVKDDDRGLYLSLQDEPDSIINLPLSPKYNVSKMIHENNLVIRSFRPGFISAEEFVHRIIQEILDEKRENPQFDRVVFDDVTQIGLRFPLLEIAPVFLPTLMDIFNLYNMTALFLSARTPSEISGIYSLTNVGLTNLTNTVIEIERRGFKSENEGLVHIRKIAGQFKIPKPLQLLIDTDGLINISQQQ